MKPATADDQTMVEKTQEVIDSVKVTFGHLFELLKNPEWLYRNSKGHAFIAHVLEEEKKQLKKMYVEVRNERIEVGDLKENETSDVIAAPADGGKSR